MLDAITYYYLFTCMCARCARLCVWICIFFIDESMAVQIFFKLLYGITNGLDITLDLLLMAWNFKDILRYVFFQNCIGNTHCL